MRYTYDPEKRLLALKDHGCDLEDAKLVIESENTVDYGEQRFVTVGMLRGEVVVVITKETDDEIRSISMWKADRNEQKIYYNNLR
ncbi:hypothetical protein AGMMS50256_06900 [Betaproteobacteria bacterium]|nr:hypothetical protein AGMMS50256_06900 [Betaproteobacteria bacterium]